MVQWITTPASNFGLAISSSVSAPSTSLFLDSKENTATSHPAENRVGEPGQVRQLGGANYLPR